MPGRPPGDENSADSYSYYSYSLSPERQPENLMAPVAAPAAAVAAPAAASSVVEMKQEPEEEKDPTEQKHVFRINVHIFGETVPAENRVFSLCGMRW